MPGLFQLVLVVMLVGAPAISFAQFSAVAYSRGSEAYGLSEAQPTEARAREVALQRCGRPDCTVQVYRPGHCIAVARASHGPWAFAGRPNTDASPGALEFCRRNGGRDCQIIVRDCLAPTASYGSEEPVPIADPRNTIVLIYTHGSDIAGRPDTCNMRQVNAPAGVPDVIHVLNGSTIQQRRVVVDGYCTPSSTTRYSRESMLREPKVMQRARDLAGRARAYVAMGVPARQIFLSGTSAGGWASLHVLRENPGVYGGAVVFAPATAGPTAGRPPREVESRRQQVLLLQNARRLDAMVFAFERDTYENPEALRFLANVPGVRFEQRPSDQIDGVRCTMPPHVLVRDACFATTQEARIRGFIASRAGAPLPPRDLRELRRRQQSSAEP
jgi:pimeloyl-ACP methyl ester carboxylesterase